jgi:hypothetical protein
MLKIVLLVLVVMTLFLWLLALLGAGPVGTYAGWLAFFAVAFLAAAVFLDGGPVVAR